MAQLTLYVDEETRRKIEEAARQANLSVSRWVVTTLVRSLALTWPQGYFELFGSLRSGDLERPEQGNFEEDSPREEMAE